MPVASLWVTNGYGLPRGLKAMLCWGKGMEGLAGRCFLFTVYGYIASKI